MPHYADCRKGARPASFLPKIARESGKSYGHRRINRSYRPINFPMAGRLFSTQLITNEGEPSDSLTATPRHPAAILCASASASSRYNIYTQDVQTLNPKRASCGIRPAYVRPPPVHLAGLPERKTSAGCLKASVRCPDDVRRATLRSPSVVRST